MSFPKLGSARSSCLTPFKTGTTIMTLNLNVSMAEATRLTRAGRLAEAMALLQGLPQKPKSPEAPEGVDRNPMRTASIHRQFIDMVPPRSGSGHWTAPSFDAHHGGDAALTEGSRLPPVPKAMRGFLAQLGKLGSPQARIGWRPISHKTCRNLCRTVPASRSVPLR